MFVGAGTHSVDGIVDEADEVSAVDPSEEISQDPRDRSQAPPSEARNALMLNEADREMRQLRLPLQPGPER